MQAPANARQELSDGATLQPFGMRFESVLLGLWFVVCTPSTGQV